MKNEKPTPLSCLTNLMIGHLLTRSYQFLHTYSMPYFDESKIEISKSSNT